MGKNSFVMYTEWLSIIEEMSSDEARGQLMSTIFCYNADRELPEMCGEARVVFAFMKIRFDKDRGKPLNSGERHWNWKGGVTPKSRADRNCAEYKHFRSAVLERDNYTCQYCGARGGKLNVHHIKHFSDYEDLRFNPDNGITLCESCHREVHKNER